MDLVINPPRFGTILMYHNFTINFADAGERGGCITWLTWIINRLIIVWSTSWDKTMTTCQHNSPGRPIYLASQTIRTNIDRLLKPFDLNREHFHLLENLDRQRGRIQSEIGSLTGKSPANTTRILDRLEKKNLIVRRENPQDRRSQLVFLTDKGADLSHEMARLLETLSARIEENIDKQDKAMVLRVLGQIEANSVKIAKDPGE